MTPEIREDNLQGAEVAVLLRVHLAGMASQSPPESMHALDLEDLRAPDVTTWTVWEGPELMGFGALKEIDADHGEIKSMHTAEQFRGRGVASHLLEHIMREAGRRSYRRLSLETGSMATFEPAHRLYRRYGFEVCAPFADYREDPNSVYFTIELPLQAEAP